MNKSKILAVALSAALVSSVAAVSASAAGIGNVSDIKSHTVGVTGSFNGWGNDGASDVALTDDGSGKFTGTITVDNVTEDMISDVTMDDGNGTQIARPDKDFTKGVTFKVRLDGDWTDSWGDYEAAYVRTWNSQTNCAVAAEVGKGLEITVTLDTTKNSPEAIAAGEVEEGDDVDYTLIPITYEAKVIDNAADESKEEESKTEESKADDTKSEAPATESSTDTSTPATGDTTSAVALVAVVLASLGVAVVMTKKASSKN